MTNQATYCQPMGTTAGAAAMPTTLGTFQTTTITTAGEPRTIKMGETAWQTTRIESKKAVVQDQSKGLIDVLYIPFGKKDYDKQTFTKDTVFRKEDKIVPGVLDFHGAAFGGSPEDVGEVVKRWTDDEGKWATILLDINHENWSKYVDAATKGSLYVSPGAIEGYFSWDESGFITDWATGEISLIIADGTKRPKNWYAIAKPRSEAIMKAAHVPYEPLFDNIKIKVKKNGEEDDDEDEIENEDEKSMKSLSQEEIKSVRTLLENSNLKSKTNIMNDTPCNCQDDLAKKDTEITALKAQISSFKAMADDCESSKKAETVTLKAALDERTAQNSALKAALDNEIAKATDKEDEDFLKGLIDNGQIEPSAKDAIKSALKAARLSDNNGLKGSGTPENGLYSALKMAYESRPKMKGFHAAIIPLTESTNVTDINMVNKLLVSGGYKEIK